MWTLGWWKDASERAIRAAISATIGILGAFGPHIGIQNLNWGIVANVALYASLSSLALSLGTQSVTHSGPGVQSEPYVDTTGRHRLR
ncbi:MAG: holin [Hyphomicrobiaceae bacterium]